MHIGCDACAWSLRSLTPRMRVCVAGASLFLGYGPARIAASLGVMSVERPPTPTEERLPAWRRACLAYREIREADGIDQQAHDAAVEAVLGVLPLLSRKEASAEAVSRRLRHQVSQ